MNPAGYLSSKPRYEVLDGLRGVAALLVVAYHLFETYATSSETHIINHGYLAVDFFFALSGYVIGYAYDDRWNRMSIGSFFKRRLVRLHPLIVLGTIIGLCTFYLGGSPAFPQVDETSVGLLLLVALIGIFMLPCPRFLDIRGWQDFAPLNGAAWSLVWEYFANILYALFIRHFRTWMIAAFVVGSGALTLALAFNIDLFGLLATRTAGAPFSVNGGFGFAPDQLMIGCTRLLYPFFAGLLLSRLNLKIRIKKWFPLVLTAHHGGFGHASHRQRSHMARRGIQRYRGACHIPFGDSNGCRQRNQRTGGRALPLAGTHFLSALHHPPALALCTDGMG